MLTLAQRCVAAVRRRHTLLREGGEEGYTLVEAAITIPAIIFVLLVIVQWAIMWHARNVAQAAAREAMRSASAYEQTAAAGQQDGRSFLARVAPNVVPPACLTVSRTATTVTVRVHCTVPSAIPFTKFDVNETITGPVETYVDAK